MRYDNMSAFIVMDIVREAAKYPNAIHFTINLVTQKALGFWRCEKKSPRIMTALIR